MSTGSTGPTNGAPLEPAPPPLTEATVGNEPINILIVDDEPKNLTVLETILADPAYRLVRAGSAEQALLALVVEEFALIILDVRMPGMTGFELAKMVKERKKTARVPIIFLTAYYNEDQDVLEGYGTGAVDYLHKPVNAAILRSKVAVFADLHRKNREIGEANRALLAEVSERRRAEERLRDLNDTLEQRVGERTEALREADRRKDEFLATLAHELRNPLAPVRNALQVIRLKSPAAGELPWATDVIDRQMQAMARLIDDLMDVSRIRLGRLALKRVRLELTQVIQNAVEATRPLIECHGHVLTVSLPSRPILLDADPIRLPQVFLNLLNNAAKFTARGGQIDLTAEEDGNCVTVSVKDSGIGIPATHLNSVFEMFSQVEDALSRTQGGLGIGLWLVKRLVEMHDGHIEVRSDGPGQGSEFLVRLPIVLDPSSDLDADRATDVEDWPKSTSKLRILVVDDNRDAASSLSMLVEMMGNTVITAYDGEEAVTMAEKHRPDVVLLDIGMPKMNGYDAARAIRQEPWGQKMVLIAVTGWGQPEDQRRSAESGFDHHAVKPIDPKVLIELFTELHSTKA